jgi:hypothetical protein
MQMRACSITFGGTSPTSWEIEMEQRQELQKVIEADLAKVKNKALNINAFNALLEALGGNPITALGKIFLGRDNAVDAERHRIERQKVLDLLCAIDEKLTNPGFNQTQQHHVVSGLIEAYGVDGDVIGLHIEHDAPSVLIGKDAVIRAVSSGNGKVTGVKISGRMVVNTDNPLKIEI